MRRIWVVALAGVLLSPSSAYAGNADEVNAGLDVTLTGGAVVANVYTGASLWYNPAGIARSDKPSLERLYGRLALVQPCGHRALRQAFAGALGRHHEYADR
jgi:hypothetical protein